MSNGLNTNLSTTDFEAMSDDELLEYNAALEDSISVIEKEKEKKPLDLETAPIPETLKMSPGAKDLYEKDKYLTNLVNAYQDGSIFRWGTNKSREKLRKTDSFIASLNDSQYWRDKGYIEWDRMDEAKKIKIVESRLFQDPFGGNSPLMGDPGPRGTIDRAHSYNKITGGYKSGPTIGGYEKGYGIVYKYEDEEGKEYTHSDLMQLRKSGYETTDMVMERLGITRTSDMMDPIKDSFVGAIKSLNGEYQITGGAWHGTMGPKNRYTFPFNLKDPKGGYDKSGFPNIRYSEDGEKALGRIYYSKDASKEDAPYSMDSEILAKFESGDYTKDDISTHGPKIITLLKNKKARIKIDLKRLESSYNLDNHNTKGNSNIIQNANMAWYDISIPGYTGEGRKEKWKFFHTPPDRITNKLDKLQMNDYNNAILYEMYQMEMQGLDDAIKSLTSGVEKEYLTQGSNPWKGINALNTQYNKLVNEKNANRKKIDQYLKSQK